MTRKNYHFIGTFLAITVVFSMVFLETVQARDNAVIKNTVSSSHSTGGQTSHGQAGADGLPGQDGTAGQDGISVNTSAETSKSRAQIDTTIDGEVIASIERTATLESGTATAKADISASSSATTSSSKENSNDLSSNTNGTSSANFSFTHIFLSIRLMLANYVNQLF